MDIEKGKMYINKTSLYLLPVLKTLSYAFLAQLSKVITLLQAVAISDKLYDKTNNCLFLLFDTTNERFKVFLKYIRIESFYVDDYIYDGVDKLNQCCIVIKIPDEYNNAFTYFKESQYSKMYTHDQLKTLGFSAITANAATKAAYYVLTKDQNYVPVFEKIVNDIFGTNVTIDDDRELDLPINNNFEIFNNGICNH